MSIPYRKLSDSEVDALHILLSQPVWTGRRKVYTARRTSPREGTIHPATAYTLWRRGLLRYGPGRVEFHVEGIRVQASALMKQLYEEF